VTKFDAKMVNRGMQDSPAWWDLLGAQKGRLLFDVGANVGQAAHHMAPNFERVVSFEPCDESFEILEAERPSNVTPVKRAVSNIDGFIFLNESANSIKDGSLTTGSGRLTWGVNVGMRGVPAVTLNTVAAEYGTPNVVKVDVEGHEVKVLEGASDLFGYSSFFVEMHGRELEAPVRELLCGYEIVRYENMLECVVGIEGNQRSEDAFYLAATL
jgi:FkbM family methyltransferase